MQSRKSLGPWDAWSWISWPNVWTEHPMSASYSVSESHLVWGLSWRRRSSWNWVVEPAALGTQLELLLKAPSWWQNSWAVGLPKHNEESFQSGFTNMSCGRGSQLQFARWKKTCSQKSMQGCAGTATVRSSIAQYRLSGRNNGRSDVDALRLQDLQLGFFVKRRSWNW